jgi:anti-anti-sigma factor
MARVSIIDKEEMLTVKLGGYMDTPSTPDVEKGLEPLLTKVDKDVLFDCINLDYIASSVLRLLLRILKNAKANSHHVYITNISPTIREAFRLTGFLKLFEQLES